MERQYSIQGHTKNESVQQNLSLLVSRDLDILGVQLISKFAPLLLPC